MTFSRLPRATVGTMMRRVSGFIQARSMLGRLVQHPPVPLRVPRRYLGAPAPRRPLTISVVTPTRNQQNFIAHTIKSLAYQQYHYLEYTIQDGASTDDTLNIIERFRPYIASVESAPDEGYADAVNMGFRRTSGEIMAYLNSDDILLPGSLAYVSEYFRRHPDVDVIYAHRVLIDENGGEIGRWVLPPHDAAVYRWEDYVPQETLFWRRALWEKTGGALDQTYRFAADWELLLRFDAAGARFRRIPRFLAAFRVHPEQKTSAEMAEIGAREIAALQKRYYGRELNRAEIDSRVRGFLTKHVLWQMLYRKGLLGH